MRKLPKENNAYNSGYNQALIDCIQIIDESLYQSGCPNFEDGLPATFFIEDCIVTCYGDKSEYRDKAYTLASNFSKKQKRTN